MSHDEHAIRAGLTQLALCNDNAAEAARRLANSEHPIAESTLRGFKDRHPDKFEEIRGEVVPQIHAAIASENEALAREAVEVERKLLADIEQAREAGTLKDLPATLRNVSVTKGISLDKVLPMRDRPTQIVGYKPGRVDELLRDLEALVGPGFVTRGNPWDAESTAEELPPAA